MHSSLSERSQLAQVDTNQRRSAALTNGINRTCESCDINGPTGSHFVPGSMPTAPVGLLKPNKSPRRTSCNLRFDFPQALEHKATGDRRDRGAPSVALSLACAGHPVCSVGEQQQQESDPPITLRNMAARCVSWTPDFEI